MNKRYLDYANYNIWANDRLIQDLSAHNASLLDEVLVGSFPSIRATLTHVWFAESGWLSRLTGNGWDTSEINNFKGNSQELFQAWQETSKQFRNFVEQADLEELITFKHRDESFSIPAREIVQTVFNHGSFHRGQIVTMMRQLGINKITQTDYIEWVRENERRKK